MPGVVQLSCEQCRRRKTKCDRSTPCTSCQASHLTCIPVQRTRLPRGRTKDVTNKNSNLREKVIRLEKLIIGLETQVNGDSPGGPRLTASGSPPNLDRSHTNKLEKSTARDFWIALSDEVIGLRETLEESADDDVEDLRHSSSSESNDNVPLIAPLFAPSSLDQVYAHLPDPCGETRSLLIHLYRTRADWLFKILHWPTVSSMLNHNSTRNDSATSPIDLALTYAIYFLAICTLLGHEFWEHRLGERTALVKQYQRATEISLTQAGLLTTTDTTLLQAFVIYIAAIRCSVSAAAAWTLIATAIRIAHACNLNTDSPTTYSAYEMEIRRRLWFSIGFLDSQTSFGRGTLPLLSHQDLLHPPQVIDDTDMTTERIVPRPPSDFTDMSFAKLCHQAMVCQRKLIDPDFGSWRARLEIVKAFEVSVTQDYAHFEFSTDARQAYTAFAARSMPTTMQLLLRRPLYKNFQNAIPPSDGYNVLEVGCSVLQTGLTKASFEGFAEFSWFKWPKWFALAVVLVELCSSSQGSAFDRAFAVAQESYNDYAQSAADLSAGQLWRPIVKLMRRVRKLKEAYDMVGNSTDRTKAQYVGELGFCANALDLPLSTGFGNGHMTEPQHVDSLPTLREMSTPSASTTGRDCDDSWIQWDAFLNDFNDPDMSGDFFSMN